MPQHLISLIHITKGHDNLMATPVDLAFKQFLETISITDNQRDTFIPNRYTRISEILTDAFDEESDMPFWFREPMGSASKGTITRPVDDIDVLAVFSDISNIYENDYYDNSFKFLYRVRKAFDKIHTQDVGARGQAIRIFFKTGGHVDVAPVFQRQDNVFLLPAGDGTWIPTNPPKANEWLNQKDILLEGNLKPLVRMLKRWNSAHSKRLSSFHLETMVASIFASMSPIPILALIFFFENAEQYIDVGDPGGESGLLSSYLDNTNNLRAEVVASFNRATNLCKKALHAEVEEDYAEALRLLKIVFGEDFPEK